MSDEQKPISVKDLEERIRALEQTVEWLVDTVKGVQGRQRTSESAAQVIMKSGGKLPLRG